MFKHIKNVKHSINIFPEYQMADIRHFEFTYIISVFATPIVLNPAARFFRGNIIHMIQKCRMQILYV